MTKIGRYFKAVYLVVALVLMLSLGIGAGPMARTAEASVNGWEWQNPLPQGNLLRGVWGTSSNDVFTVGLYGTILHYSGTMKLVEGVNVIPYTGVTIELPAAVTDIGPDGMDVVEVIWARSYWTGGEWWFYDFTFPAGSTLDELENGWAYIIVVTEPCTWNLPH